MEEWICYSWFIARMTWHIGIPNSPEVFDETVCDLNKWRTDFFDLYHVNNCQEQDCLMWSSLAFILINRHMRQ